MNVEILVIGGGATGLGVAWDAALRGYKTLLVEKGVLSWDECSEMFDQAQHLIEQQQNCDVPANAEIWRIARNFLEHLAVHPMLSETTGVDRN